MILKQGYIYDGLEKYVNNANNNKKAYIIYNNEEIAGFTLLDLLDDKNIIQEMFILNNYKRKGIGKAAVYSILDKFKGNWEIKSLPCSENAEKFWTSIIKEYTNNKFNLEYIGKFHRAVLKFNNE